MRLEAGHAKIVLESANKIASRQSAGALPPLGLPGVQRPAIAVPIPLRYGVSVTDPCIDWDTTVEVIRKARSELRAVLPCRGA